jgi:acetylornithine/N-succinyldiaminopimelate aminotransferase
MNTMSLYEEVKALDDTYVLKTYNRQPGLFVRGEGCRIWDSEGREYLDFLAGIAVCQLGHCHPAIIGALQEQSRTLIHTSNHLLTEPQARLAERLCKISGMERVFFSSDGTTANETALKIAKKHGLQKRPTGDYEIVTLTKSFHGRTLGALSATGQEKYQAPFKPLLPGFITTPANNLEALQRVVTERTAAIVLELIQGEGGVTPLSHEFVHEAQRLCRQFDAYLIIDEVQTGVGRTGNWYAFLDYGIQPDLVLSAKGLGSGVPIGACLASGEAASLLLPGEHGSTFAGNPLACAVALAVLDTIEKEGLLARTREVGEVLAGTLRELPLVREVRGRGLMLGAALEKPVARKAVSAALVNGVITNATDEETLRVVPPLIVTEDEVASFGRVMHSVLATL